MKQSLALLLLLAACKEEIAEMPLPVAMTDDALGYFCMMELAGMEGPKAQIHLKGMPDPIFFGQVRDGVAYLKEPETPLEITAFYVTDLSAAPSWENPGEINWVTASDAFFVVGANVTGGMGAPELAPFATRSDALAFAAKHGGEVVTLIEVPDTAVLGSIEAAVLKGDNG